jgi:hypothetical protein
MERPRLQLDEIHRVAVRSDQCQDAARDRPRTLPAHVEGSPILVRQDDAKRPEPFIIDDEPEEASSSTVSSEHNLARRGIGVDIEAEPEA